MEEKMKIKPEYEIHEVEEIFREKGYQVRFLTGKGATAQVYCITEKRTGSNYACKISNRMEWISQEAALLKKLRHPLFPSWKDYWEEGNWGYLVMEYIAGSSLEEHLTRRGSFSQQETVRTALALADGLGYLHERKQAVIYRDLKPANIMIQPDGGIRVLDLGAAAIRGGWRAGTPGYAAPELLGEGRPQPVSDVYTLGMVMHHMLTGHNPCHESEEILPVRAYRQDISLGLEDIVWRCTRKQPEERIPGMRELIREISMYYNRTRFQIACQELKWLAGRRRKQVVYEKNVWESAYKTDLP